ncbi:MAG TPA: RICIN domain-containing protein [Actinocrinis sp.]|jgi:hypothetical protein|uniref:RICIN domain-containing protein n=1 Tax=Actinocrinis sp. TaxID=1920516 RepID=UPI002DDD0332|nr:RICIN domain-containing protein [Actinocrinis sp.]HEV3170723.1 RICIN domain-containing protein [Actinocrinis sp.]
MRGLRRFTARAAGLTAALGLALGGTVLFGASPAQALGPGEVCAFMEPDGGTVLGNNFGHIGWGFLVAGSSSWIYGATENPNGAYQINAPGFNGAWKAQGSWTDMIDDFTFQYDYPSHDMNSQSNSPYPAHPYTEYKCELTSGSAVGAAITAATNNISAGYTGLGNNCLDATYRVLNTYGAPNLPWPSTHPRPYQDWYQSLDSSAWDISGKLGETWINGGSGQMLDVSGPSTADGALVHQWTYTGADNQWWFRPWQADGYTRLFSRYSGKCLGISGGSTAAGAKAVQWSCNGNPDQTWYFQWTGASTADGWPIYNIVNYNSGQCLGIWQGSTAVGAQAIQWPCNGNPDQEWH